MPLPKLLHIKSASGILGALFFGLLSLSCKEQKPSTSADWAQPSNQTSSSTEEQPANSSTATPDATGSLRFLSYNIKNYLTMKRGDALASKPEKEIQALINIIVSETPDVLGICEIGSTSDLADLQSRLKNAGLDLPHTEYSGGADETRHLALLSRFPIVDTNSQTNLEYELNGHILGMQRGILDATVDIGSMNVRFLGVHLKSKREIPETPQELMRLNEAQLLRDYADSILEEHPDTYLIAYGDFNDTIRTKPLSAAMGHWRSHKRLSDYYFKDSRGELWTQFWDYQDVYSRFDYVLYTNNLTPLIDGNSSHIIDHPDWFTASDHRALMLVLK